MKTKLLSLCWALTIVSVFAQNAIPNPNFELWTTTSYESPMYFTDNSNLNCLRDNLTPNVTKVTPAQSGQYALQLKTVGNHMAYMLNTDPKEGNVSAWANGMLYNGQPTGITGYYKYNVATADSALLVVIFRKNGAAIAGYDYKLGGIKTDFTLFDFDFTPALTEVPDSMIFCLVASDFYKNQNGVDGSTLIVDNISLKGVAQQPVELNGNYENWQTEYLPPMLDSWSVNNSNTNGVSRSTDAKTGTYAVKLTTYEGEDNGNPAARPGYLSSGYWDDICGCIRGGNAFTNIKDTLAFWYKYAPQSNDQAQVHLSFMKNNSQFDSRYVNLNSATNYTYIELPFELGQVPEAVVVQAISSLWDNKTLNYLGSELLLDNMYFKSSLISTDLNKVKSPQDVIYPTCVTDLIYFDRLGKAQKEISISDLTGKCVLKLNNVSEVVNISDLNKGLYFMKVNTEGKSFQFKFIKL